METIRNDVLRAVSRRKYNKGDKFRLRHEFKRDGTICTNDKKDPAMTVTKLTRGFVYICHRCGEAGFIDNDKISPAMTKERLNRLSGPLVNVRPFTAKVTLPYDFKPMSNEKDPNIPWQAFHWIWRYSLNYVDINRWNIGWSSGYGRVILPIYEYTMSDNNPDKKLLGWIGREVKFKTKEERETHKVSKYITKKQLNNKRIFFKCPAVINTNNVILTEDIISAMKVWNALSGKVETIALLTTSVDNDLILSLKDKNVFLWLDGDMVRKSVRTVSKMRDLGLAAFHMYTPKDPKDYNELFIADMWRNRKTDK